MTVLGSGGSRPEPDPESAARCEALIDSLELAATGTWSARALLACLRSLSTFADNSVRVLDASIRSDTSFTVTYRRANCIGDLGQVLGTLGDQDPEATLLLMPHFEPGEVPLDAETYGHNFSLVGVQEPFGADDYGPMDVDGVRWLHPPDFRGL